MTYAALTAVLLGAFWAAPNVGWIQWIIVAAVGFALYGPQMLIGLCGAEVVPKPAVSAAQGFLGWISYLGMHYLRWRSLKLMLPAPICSGVRKSSS